MTGPSPALTKLLDFVRELGTTRELVIVMPSQLQVDKSAWLAAKGRDFFSVSESMKGAIAQAVIRKVRSMGAFDVASVEDIMSTVGEAARAHIVRRFEAQGFDVRLAPLSPAYAAYKAKHPFLDPRIGIAWGTLLSQLRNLARFDTRRV